MRQRSHKKGHGISVSGYDFERFLGTLFKRLGYKVQPTGMSGDFGADLVLTDPRTRERIVVQAKHYSSNLGVKPVQEVVAAKSHYAANACWVVTNSTFTPAARRLAADNAVVLVDGRELKALCRRVRMSLDDFEKGPHHGRTILLALALGTLALATIAALGLANRAAMG